jgi:hypothetical protein
MPDRENSDPTVGACYARTRFGDACALIERAYRKRVAIYFVSIGDGHF